MNDQFEVISYRPSYDGGVIPTWKCHRCGQSGEEEIYSPAYHVCPPKPHKNEVE